MQSEIESLDAAHFVEDPELSRKAQTLDFGEGGTILHTRSFDGNTETVRLILIDSTSKDLLIKLDARNRTALHYAAYGGHAKVVKVLTDAAKRLFPSSANDDHRNSVSSFEAFVWQADDSNNTALHMAAINGSVAIAKMLVEADVTNYTQVQSRNDAGETPIYLAAKYGHKDMVTMIFSTCRAPISLLGPYVSGTALHAAIMSSDKENRKELVMILIDGAKRPSSSENHDPHGISLEGLFEKTNSRGQTALGLAVEENALGIIEVISAEDPAYQSKKESKTDELKNLVRKAAKRGYKDIVKLLCETYEALNTYDNKGPAFLAAIMGHDKDSVCSLLRGDPNLATYIYEGQGWTALHYAAYCGFEEILEDIVEAQIKVNYEPEYRRGTTYTPLIVAAQQGHTTTLIQLLKLLPPYSYVAVTDQGQNILHFAAAGSNKEMIREIMKCCSNTYYIEKILNAQDFNGDTPLHLVVKNGCFVSELIEHKSVNRMARNKDNWTAVDMLYLQDDIIADQVKIKKALDDIRDNDQYWKFWRKSNKSKNLVQGSKRSEKDKDFEKGINILKNEKLNGRERRREKLRERRRRGRDTEGLQLLRNRANNQVIVTALIATVTFTVGFTMPGGYHQSGEPNQGLVLLSKEKIFNVFMVSDAVALVLSMSCLFLHFCGAIYEDTPQLIKFNLASTILNIFSIVAMMLTFITGTFVVLSHSLALAISICVVCSFFFILVLVILIKFKYDYYQ